MVLLAMPPPAQDDRKRQVGAYLCLGETHLYEVIDVNDDGTVKAANVRTGYLYDMSTTNIKRARLVTPLTDAEWAETEAAFDATPSIPDP